MSITIAKEKMSSRQRVLTTFARKEADRVPINYSANPDIDARLKAHFGLKSNNHEGLRKALGVDFRGYVTPYTGTRLYEEVPGRQVNAQWGIRTRWLEHGQGGYWDYCDFPLKDADEEQVAALPMPSPDDFDYSQVTQWCKDNDYYALYLGNAGVGDIINTSGMIRSMEQVLMDLATDDPAWQLWVDRKHAIEREVIARTLEAAKGRIDFMWMGEDLGTQNTPMISLKSFRKHIRPRHQKFIDMAKSYDLPVMIHTCGSSGWAYDDFIEMGINVVDTLQPEATNMAPAYLKEKFGDRLAFHGCISTAGPVSFGTVEEVKKDCRQTLETMMPGGGYCFAPTHSLQDNSPTENVLAMYQIAHECGVYK